MKCKNSQKSPTLPSNLVILSLVRAATGPPMDLKTICRSLSGVTKLYATPTWVFLGTPTPKLRQLTWPDLGKRLRLFGIGSSPSGKHPRYVLFSTTPHPPSLTNPEKPRNTWICSSLLSLPETCPVAHLSRWSSQARSILDPLRLLVCASPPTTHVPAIS